MWVGEFKTLSVGGFETDPLRTQWVRVNSRASRSYAMYASLNHGVGGSSRPNTSFSSPFKPKPTVRLTLLVSTIGFIGRVRGQLFERFVVY